jgi:LPXTG-motif cell wall-anchored protein
VKVTCVPEGYEPTKPGVGDRDKDSSTGEAESTDLTKDGDRDDTLDFGFVKTPVETPEPTPTEDPAPTPTPTKDPSPEPTEPVEEPSPAPTDLPSPTPTEDPAPQPTEYPSPTPTDEPEPAPTVEPEPTEEPAPAPAPAPAPSESPKDDLRPTGGDMALPLGALGLTLLLGGVAVYAMRRRTQQ